MCDIKSSSYIRIKAEKLCKACTSLIATIDRKRKESDERDIAELIERSKKRFFFFRKKPISREQAISFLTEDWAKFFPSMRCCQQRKIAIDLRRISYLAEDDMVLLSRHDAEQIFHGQYEEEKING